MPGRTSRAAPRRLRNTGGVGGLHHLMQVSRGVLLAVAGVLLLSYGGAVFAAPVTLPLIALASRSTSSTRYRVAAAVVAGLTAAELAWALVYVTVGEETPAVWLLPLLVGVAVLAAVVRLRHAAGLKVSHS